MGKLGNYLRTYRTQWQLTQGELAFLFGYDAESVISRLERSERAVTLAVACACQTIFGVQPSELFPAAFESMEETVVNRMYELRALSPENWIVFS
jgi:transcriptional regulator with XRE-family HTH domain